MTGPATLRERGVGSRRPRFGPEEKAFLKLPEGRTLGMVMCVDIAPDGHVWVLHSTRFTTPGFPDTEEDRATRLPEVVEFDADGTFIRAWGGIDHLPRIDGAIQWPDLEETIAVDGEGCVWIFGSRRHYDHAALRFAPDGNLLLRLGRYGEKGDDHSRDLLNVPTDVYLDVERREAFISDGYGNHRVVTFNVDTGDFIRSWGGGGREPGDDADAFSLVHSISRGPDGLLYVSDRLKNRVQVFDAVGCDVRFVREIAIAPGTLGFGAAAEVAFTRDGAFMYAVDNSNSCIWIVDMAEWRVIGWFVGPTEEGSGNTPEIYYTPHRVAVDDRDNLLVARVAGGFSRYPFQGVS